jgi:hypothetical protein
MKSLFCDFVLTSSPLDFTKRTNPSGSAVDEKTLPILKISDLRKVPVNYALLGVLMIAGPTLYAVEGVWLSRRIQHGRVQEGHNDVLVPIFLNAGVLFAVLLGFMVVAV